MLELWGGVECTVNRIDDIFRDQLEANGHEWRASDLDLFQELGIAALRYPVLWERVAPDAPDRHDWQWSDARLEGLRSRGIRPIVGLVHHGSGPRYTNLLADDFALGLARYAGAVAERYPWVEEWTPVNEPVTTARFSALYGHWYPHRRDERSFWIALLNQVDGVRLAMRAVRRVNSAAKLIQTEDLGRTYATAAVRDQAAFDNARRWMSWDLLCGRVLPGHDLWTRLCGFGLEERLRAIADDPCPPDVIGVNHYLTSDRFLDHRIERYPPSACGGNGRQRFADIEAVRVLQPSSAGLGGALREAWNRYGIPLAVSEVHNGCTREEQLRWIFDAWHVSAGVRAEGVDVRAVTSWALLGSSGWDTLLTGGGRYEPGAFDVSSGSPRPTALVPLLKGLATSNDRVGHPVLAGEGWWRRSIRLHYEAVSRPAPLHDWVDGSAARPREGAPILIVGATGTLGGALAAACRHRDLPHVSTTRAELDLSCPESIARVLDTHRPWAVVNAAGWVRVDEAESERRACFEANATGAARLAEACDARDIASVCFSSDLVFGGDRGKQSYVEADATAPVCVYGESKARAEEAILALPGRHMIVRTAAFFSPFDGHNFAVHLVPALAEGAPFQAAEDEVVSPTYVPDLCDAVLDLVIDGEAGIWHLTNGEALSWAAFARRVAEGCGLDADLVQPVPGATLGRAAPRPASSALESSRGTLLPTLDHAIRRFAREVHRSAMLAREHAA